MDFAPPDSDPVDRTVMSSHPVGPTDLNSDNDLGLYFQNLVDNNNLAGQLLEVEAGHTYTWSVEVVVNGPRDWGVQGQGGTGDVVIDWPHLTGIGENQTEDHFFFINIADGGNIIIENITHDSSGRAEPGVRYVGSGPMTFNRIRYLMGGVKEDHHWGTSRLLLGHSSGEVLCERFVCHNRGYISYWAQDSRGIWCSGDGDLTVRLTKLTGFPDNTVYTRMAGNMLVEDSVFANSTGGIRVGGFSPGEEIVQHCTFHVDTSRGELYGLNDGSINTPGVQYDPRGAGPYGTVKHCSFHVEETPHAAGALRFLLIDDFQHAEHYNLQFNLNDPGVPGLGFSSDGTAHEITIQDSSFTSSESTGVCNSDVNSGTTYYITNTAVGDGVTQCEFTADTTGAGYDETLAHPFPVDTDFSYPSEGNDIPSPGNFGDSGDTFRGYSFDRVVNAVVDFGLDDTGTNDVSSSLESQLQSGDLVIFPDGDYRFDSTVNFSAPDDLNVGFVSKAAYDSGTSVDATDPNATYDYTHDVDFHMHTHAYTFDCGGTMGYLFEGFSIINDRSNNYVGGIDVSGDRDCDVRNVNEPNRGADDHDAVGLNESPSSLRIDLGGTATLTCHKCDWPHGSDKSSFGRRGIAGQPGSGCTVNIVGCTVSEFGKGGIDMSLTLADVLVNGCRLENNNVALVRAVNDADVRNCELVYDESLYNGPLDETGSSYQARVIWTESGSRDQTAWDTGAVLTVTDNDVTVRDAFYEDGNDGPAGIVITSEAPPTRVDGTDIDWHTPTAAAQKALIQRNGVGSDGNGELVVDNTIIDGGATDGLEAYHANDAVGTTASSTAGSQVTNCCFEIDDSSSGTTGAQDVDGVHFDSTNLSYDAEAKDSTINVGGQTFVTGADVTLTTSNIDESGSCSTTVVDQAVTPPQATIGVRAPTAQVVSGTVADEGIAFRRHRSGLTAVSQNALVRYGDTSGALAVANVAQMGIRSPNAGVLSDTKRDNQLSSHKLGTTKLSGLIATRHGQHRHGGTRH